MSAVDAPRSTRRRNRAQAASSADADAPLTDRSNRRTLLLSLAGAVLVWAALPPLGWSLLAWAAPIPWLLLVQDQEFAGGRPYRMLWLAGFLHWLAVLQGIRLAHWATYIGWVVLAAYLAIYLPLFIALTRIAVHRWKTPLVLAAPVVWTGLEYARGYVATGFSMALLGHTQVRWTPLLQIADLFGAYGVSFVVMFIAACLTSCLPRSPAASLRERASWCWRPLIPLALVLAGTIGYGYYRTSQPAEVTSRPALKAALVQGWVDTIFDYNPERDVATFNTYADLSRKAAAEHPDLDLIVWPEWVFTDVRPLVTREERIAPPSGVEWPEQIDRHLAVAAERFSQKTRGLARDLGQRTSLVVGVSVLHYGGRGVQQYNSAAHIGPAGEVVGRYDKMHPVMFGEYVPFGDLFPWVYRFTPLGGGLARGKRPEAFEIAGLRLAPSVCFESTVPHLIRRHVVELEERGLKPDVLVNHTNDGWFWGSSIIDLHLACGVFRAVEHRTPMLIAANTGLSAWIDGDGRVRAQGPRFDEAILVAEVRPDRRSSLYTRLGDWPAAACLAFCLAAAAAPLVGRFGLPRASNGA